MTGVHIHLDIDGDPHSYHVEYLGSPHTHSWVTAKHVEVYGHKENETTVTKIVKTGVKRGRKVTAIVHMSHVVRKPAFCICKNKGADPLRSKGAIDQRLYFR